jgi:predicted trehalose synthase
LPESRDQLNELLHFLLLKRAILEIRQELERRGEHVDIPLNGLLALVNGDN